MNIGIKEREMLFECLYNISASKYFKTSEISYLYKDVEILTNLLEKFLTEEDIKELHTQYLRLVSNKIDNQIKQIEC